MNDTAEPMITTIIPTYRRPKLLQRAIRSVLNQTYPHFQVRVYDNASGDETAQIVAEFKEQDQRVTYHCHDENTGAMANFQYGYERVDTPYFSFLSDDKVLFPGLYEQAVQHLEKNHQDIFYCTPVLYGDKEEQPYMLAAWPEGRYSPPDSYFRMWHDFMIIWDGTLFRREVRDIMDKFTGLYSDMALIMRCALQHPFYFAGTPGAGGLLHGRNLSLTMDMQMIRGALEQLRRDIVKSRTLSPELRKPSMAAWKKMAIARFYSMSAKKYIEGDLEQVRQAAECLAELGDSRRARILRVLCSWGRLGEPFWWVTAKVIMARKLLLSRHHPKLTREEAHRYQKFLAYITGPDDPDALAH